MTTRSEVEPNVDPPMLDLTGLVEPGGQRYFELGKPLLSLSPLWGDARDCAGQMRATQPGGQPKSERQPERLDLSLAGPRS